MYDCEKESLEKVQTSANTICPRARNSHAACVDPIKGHMYIFGGADESGLFGDLWQ